MSTPTVARKRKTKPGQVISYSIAGIKHRQRVLAGKWVQEILVAEGWRRVMNTELPRDDDGYIAHPQDGVCAKCGHIYSHLMRSAGQPCDECKVEKTAHRGEALQRLLRIDLGWTRRDPITERHIHGYREPIRFGMKDAW